MSFDHGILIDSTTPVNEELTGIYKKSFAFFTIKERHPRILTSMIDYFVQNKLDISKNYGENASEDVKKVIGELSKLKYEIQTNKQMSDLQAQLPDTKIWNNFLNELNSEKSTHFGTVWLYQECYLYRRITDMFYLTSTLKKFDPFRQQKCDAFKHSLTAISALAKYLINTFEKIDKLNVQNELFNLLKLNLWGNKCDLSLSLGKESAYNLDPLASIEQFKSFLLVNDSETIYEILKCDKTNNIVDIITDNVGYELFTDFCLADFLLESQLAKKVRFYIKAMPWFVSDVNYFDFGWMLEQLSESDNEFLMHLGKKWNQYQIDNKWTIEVEIFWTLPFSFCEMKDKDQQLYDKLSEAKLIVFKGDLNYRKLLNEINWDVSTPFCKALKCFYPSNLCALRTCKADLICGLDQNLADELDKKSPDWKISGEYGLIQCYKTN